MGGRIPLLDGCGCCCDPVRQYWTPWRPPLAFSLPIPGISPYQPTAIVLKASAPGEVGLEKEFRPNIDADGMSYIQAHLGIEGFLLVNAGGTSYTRRDPGGDTSWRPVEATVVLVGSELWLTRLYME
ncbi:MAG: hypothetical protein ACRDD1_09855, partial [Planctomycetia bacterium]